MGVVERWSQKDQKKKNIQCPQLVLQYNKGMGGVDLADMLISLYRTKIKTRRWYIKIFWHLVDMAKVNAWLLYCRHGDQLGIPEKQRLSSLDFALEIAECLITANKEVPMETSTGKPGRPSKRKSAGYKLTSEKCIALFATEKLYHHPIHGNYQMWVQLLKILKALKSLKTKFFRFSLFLKPSSRFTG